MIITKTPLRLSIAGGGCDLPVWTRDHSAMFISAAIDKFIYTTVHRSQYDRRIRARYSKMEEVDSIDQIQNSILRETLKRTGSSHSIEFTSHAEIPSGSGLGSSGSFGVGALQALYGLYACQLSPSELARVATLIQAETLNLPIGPQDQYAAAFGGFRAYEIDTGGRIQSSPITVSTLLSDRLCLFPTGIVRDATEVLKASSTDGLSEVQALAWDARKALECRDYDTYGETLKEHWEQKKRRGGMSSPQIDEMHELAMKNGAIGAKIVGAGGGGFLLCYTKQRKELTNAMFRAGYRNEPFSFEPRGSRIINHD